MALTAIDESRTPEVARELVERSQAEPEAVRRGIIEMITTIVVYKFTHLSRQEAEAMLGITSLQETRFYQEAKEDGLAEGRVEEGRSLIRRLLNRRFGELPTPLIAQVESLSLTQIETLAEALFDLQSIADLEAFLSDRSPANPLDDQSIE